MSYLNWDAVMQVKNRKQFFFNVVMHSYTPFGVKNIDQNGEILEILPCFNNLTNLITNKLISI